MATFVRCIICAGVLALGASCLAAEQKSSTAADQLFKAKLGRSSPAEEARKKAEAQSTAYREEAPAEAAAHTWKEQYFKAKFGRNPAQEARQKADQGSTAYREEATSEAAAPTTNWRDEFFKAKYGRRSPKAQDK